jgi:hypothetical protein
MDMQTIINLGGTALLASLGYFFKENAAKVSQLEMRNHDLEMRMAQEYVRKDELTNHLTRASKTCSEKSLISSTARWISKNHG